MKVKKFESINVVPFIDIMLVLLVIVLTTATFVAKGIIPVELPASKSAQKNDDDKALTITIKQNGEVLFNKLKVTQADYEKELAKFESNTPVHINCDKEARFNAFIELLDVLKLKNFKNLGIVSKKDS